MVGMHKHIEIIMNPIAGAGRARSLVDRLSRRLRGQGHRVTAYCTGSAGDGRTRAAALFAPDADAVLVAGGDGTISEVIDGLVSAGGNGTARPPLAILPVGTENLLGKVLGARPNIAQAEATLLGGLPVQLDVGHRCRPADQLDGWDAGAGPPSGHFLMVAGAGFDAEVVHRLHSVRAGRITYADYLDPILRTLVSYQFPPIRVEADGQVICEEPALVFLGNIPRYALGLPICLHAQADDGLLDLVVFKCARFGQLVMHSLRTILRCHLRHPGVVYRQVRCAVIRARQDVQLEVDGDDCGQLPVRFTMPGKQVRLLAPPKDR